MQRYVELGASLLKLGFLLGVTLFWSNFQLTIVTHQHVLSVIKIVET